MTSAPSRAISSARSTRAGLRSALAVPIHRGLETLGALFFARGDTPYAHDDVQVATLLAASVAAALETSRLYQALADERSTLAAVLGSTQDAVLMVNEEGVVVLANPAVRGGMLGLVPESMTGRPVSAVEHPPLRRLLEERRAGVTELPLPDGRTAQASVVSVITGYGESLGLAAVLRDITLLKEARADEERLREHGVARPEEPDHGHRRHRRPAPGSARRGPVPRALRAHQAGLEVHDGSRSPTSSTSARFRRASTHRGSRSTSPPSRQSQDRGLGPGAGPTGAHSARRSRIQRARPR